MQLIPVILCGGVGSRFWPVSRELHPKPFIRLPDGYSLLQKSMLRASSLPMVQDLVTVLNSENYTQFKEDIDELNLSNQKISYILEPMRRNTAAAVASAALHIAQTHNEEALILVMGVDHLNVDQDVFEQIISVAAESALTGKLITFGMLPCGTNTLYDYAPKDKENPMHFVDKTPFQMAKKPMVTNQFLWNSNLFLFKAGTLLQAMKEHCPDILLSSASCLQLSKPSSVDSHSVKLELDPTSFFNIRESSLNDAVIKKSQHTAVMPCDLSWIDNSSWNNLGNLVETDTAGNRIAGHAYVHEAKNCYIQSADRVVAAVGVEHLVIVDTPDALLVANKYCVHDVKQIYTQLKQKDHDTYKLHKTTHYPWGSLSLLEANDQFQIKRIEVQPGGSLDLDDENNRQWLVVNGIAKVSHSEGSIVLNTLHSAPSKEEFLI